MGMGLGMPRLRLRLLAVVLAACSCLCLQEAAAAGKEDGEAAMAGFDDDPWLSVKALPVGYKHCQVDRATVEEVYGDSSAAVSAAMLYTNPGSDTYATRKSCGRCFRVVCDDEKAPELCKTNSSVTVTATTQASRKFKAKITKGVRDYFALSRPFLEQIADTDGADEVVVPVRYRRVNCIRKDGVRFKVNMFTLVKERSINTLFPSFSVEITNVGGSGTIKRVQVKGSRKNEWKDMESPWRTMRWTADGIYLKNQDISFIVTTTGGEELEFTNVVPPSNGYTDETFIARDGKNFSY